MKIAENVFSELWGFVLYDVEGLASMGFAPGDDVLTPFTQTSAGDEACAEGNAIPVMGVEAGGYTLAVRQEHEASLLTTPALVSPGWVLRVRSELRVSGLGYLARWQPASALPVPAPPRGWYEVTLHGGVVPSQDGDEQWIVEFVMAHATTRPPFTARLDTSFGLLGGSRSPQR